MPKHWYDRRACMKYEFESEEERQLNLRILAEKKPYFMSYIYPTQMRDYKRYIKAVRERCDRELIESVDDVQAKPPSERTEFDELLLEYYFYRMPVGINVCTANRIAWLVEDEIDEFLKELRQSSRFDYDLLKSDTPYKLSTYYRVKKLYEDFQKLAAKQTKRARVAKQGYVEGTNNSAERKLKLRQLKQDMNVLCSNDEELCNILIDICKKGQGNISIVWEMFGDVIVNRFLAANGNTANVIVPDEDGTIEYGGGRYEMVNVNLIQEQGGDVNEDGI